MNRLCLTSAHSVNSTRSWTVLASRGFSNINKDDEEKATKEFLERERKHFESLPDKEKHYYQAFRLALIKSVEENWRDKNNWWNKVQTMTQDQIEALPNEYIRKFGSFIIKA